MWHNHPKINVKPNRTDNLILLLGWIVIGMHLIYIVISLDKLPETIPTHFTLQGDVDGYGSKNTVWYLAIIGFLLYALLHYLVKNVPPWKFNYATIVTENNAQKIYALGIRMLVFLNLGVALLFFLVSRMIIARSDGSSAPVESTIFYVMIIGTALGPLVFIFKMSKIPR